MMQVFLKKQRLIGFISLMLLICFGLWNPFELRDSGYSPGHKGRAYAFDIQTAGKNDPEADSLRIEQPTRANVRELLFGCKRFKACIISNSKLSSDKLVDKLIEDLNNWSAKNASTTLDDDLTLVVVDAAFSAK